MVIDGVLDAPVTAAEEAVDRGIALLDAKGPAGWRERVDLDRLDIRSLSSCILGQVYGHFDYGYDDEDLGLAHCVPYDDPMSPSNLGFDHGVHAADLLTAIWVRKLRPAPLGWDVVDTSVGD